MNEQKLSEIFTCKQLSLFIEDIQVTISARQYLITEHVKAGALTTDEEKLLGLWEFNQQKEEELNTFIQMLVIYKNAWAIRKKFETMQSN